MDDEGLTYNLWRIRKTYLKMVHDRGYMVLPAELEATVEDFKAQYGDKPVSQMKPCRTDLNTLISHSDDPSREIVIVMYEEAKIGVKHVRSVCQRMQDENIEKAIIVVQSSITPSAKACINSMAPKYLIETFLEAELMINITQHKLVPQHIVMSKKECDELLSRYKIKDYQLPKIQMSDPVARYYGVEKGQIFKIVRISETAGRYITYRIVV